MENIIHFLTLNIWGLPLGFSADKKSRIKAIATALSSSNYDIVSLQELWLKKDYMYIKDQVKETLPFHHYFYSGVIGSGLAIFSKWPIEEVFYYQFPMNGLFHMIHHGDWFGGKGVGLAVINVNGIKVNVYNTHLHANYSSKDSTDPYRIHRLIQLFDTALFIKLTSGDVLLSILGGDLNSTPDDPGVQILKCLGALDDAWEVADIKDKISETNDSKRNSYRQKRLPNDFAGSRIDYILFKTSYQMKVPKCHFPFEEKIPGMEISYSDHEAVAAEFCFINQPVQKKVNEDSYQLQQFLTSFLEACKEETKIIKRKVQGCFSLIILFIAVLLLVPFFIFEVFPIKIIIIIIIVFICFLVALIVTQWQDLSWLKNARKRIKIYAAEHHGKGS